jgi:hypothetical protein
MGSKKSKSAKSSSSAKLKDKPTNDINEIQDKKLLDKRNQFIEDTINWTLPGATFFYRDVDLTRAQIDKYQPGTVIRSQMFTDTTSIPHKCHTNMRYLIVSAHAAPMFLVNPDVEKWKLYTLNLNSYFNVLDIYQLSPEKTQILLLHIPYRAKEMFSGSLTLEFSEINDLVALGRTKFEQTSEFEEEDNNVYLDPIWIDRCKMPVGIDDEGELYTLEPTPISGFPLIFGDLFNGIRKLSEDMDPINHPDFQ